MARERLIDIPLNLNTPHTVRVPGGPIVRAAAGPADFPTHVRVQALEAPNVPRRIQFRFIYYSGNDEKTYEEKQGEATVEIGVSSGRLFCFVAPLADEHRQIRFRFDVDVATERASARRKKQHKQVSAREVAHYQAISGLLSFIEQKAIAL